MADDPVTWISGHIQVGVDLREECWSIRTKAKAEAWRKRELQWAKEALEGVAAHSPRDVARLKALDDIKVSNLPEGHPWWEPLPSGMATSSTGVGRPGNNPLSCHVRRIEELRKIEKEWRVALPSWPKLTDINITEREFENWYKERADVAYKTGMRSSRKRDHREAVAHFGCKIPLAWIRHHRRILPADHPFHIKGRRPAT